MMLEKDYRRAVREKEEADSRAQRRARGEPEPEKGYDAPTSKVLSAREKLDAANRGFLERDEFVEPPLTDAERGMSEFAFAQLPPKRRLEIANRAMLSRRGVS